MTVPTAVLKISNTSPLPTKEATQPRGLSENVPSTALLSVNPSAVAAAPQSEAVITGVELSGHCIVFLAPSAYLLAVEPVHVALTNSRPGSELQLVVPDTTYPASQTGWQVVPAARNTPQSPALPFAYAVEQPLQCRRHNGAESTAWRSMVRCDIVWCGVLRHGVTQQGVV